MYDPPALPPAGWYPDPERPGGRHRWWNGRSWEAAWAPAASPDHLPDIGEWLSRSFARMWRHWRALAAIALLSSVPAGVVTSLALRHLFDDVVITNDEVIGWSNDRLPVAIGLVVVSSVIAAFGGIAATWLMLRTTDADRSPDPNEIIVTTTVSTSSELSTAARAFVASLGVLPRAVGWLVVVMAAMAVVVVALAIITVAVLPLGILLMLAALPLLFYLAVRYAFVFTAVVDRPGNPFTRSAQVTAGRFWATFGRMALVGIIVYGIALAINVPTSIASGNGFGGAFGNTGRFEFDDGTVETFDLSAFAPSTVAIGFGAVAALISGVVVTGLVSAALAELYRTRNPAG